MGNAGSKIEDFFTKDIKQAFEKIPDALESGFDKVGNTFENIGNDIKNSFENVGNDIVDGLKDVGQDIASPFIKFGIESKETFESIGSLLNEVGDVTDSALGYFVETSKFFGDITVGTVDFMIGVVEQLIKLIPSLTEVLKSTVKLLENGYDISSVILLILPALAIFYYAVILIETLDNQKNK